MEKSIVKAQGISVLVHEENLMWNISKNILLQLYKCKKNI